MQPVFVIYVGMNGSGKTTLHALDREYEGVEFINPDIIVKQNNWDWRSRGKNIKAGMIALERILSNINNQKSFAIETTATPWKLINQAREKGFYIEIRMVMVKDVNLSKERIAGRVNNGGHGIMDAMVNASFSRQENNIKKSIKMADHLIIFDNIKGFRKIAEFRNSCAVYIKQDEEIIKKGYEEVLQEKQTGNV